MPKKAARTKKKVTKTTKRVKATKADQSFTLVKKQDSYLSLLMVILFASLIFLGLVLSLR